MTGLISVLSKQVSRVFSSTTVPQFESLSSLVLSLLYGPSLTAYGAPAYFRAFFPLLSSLWSLCRLPPSALSPFSQALRLLLTDRNVKTKHISSTGCAC